MTRTFVLALIVAAAWISLTLYVQHHRSGVDSTALQARINAIGSQLRAPIDHNSMTVATSPDAQAETMRYEIQQDVLKGLSNREVLLDMEHRYGASILAAPAARGLGLWVWVLPIAFTVIGLGLFAGYLANRSGTGRTPQQQVEAPDRDGGKMRERILNHLRDYL